MLKNEVNKIVIVENLSKAISKTPDDSHFVIDYICLKPKISMQRMFTNDLKGKEELEELESSIKSIKDLLKIMGL